MYRIFRPLAFANVPPYAMGLPEPPLAIPANIPIERGMDAAAVLPDDLELHIPHLPTFLEEWEAITEEIRVIGSEKLAKPTADNTAVRL
jgi:hypothetical protein